LKNGSPSASITTVSDRSEKSREPAGRCLGLAILVVWLGVSGDLAAQFNLRVDSFQPTFGAAGTSVIINGADFLGTTVVRFGTAQADFDVLSSTQIRATVPAQGQTGSISVVNSFSASSATHFTVAPRISGFDKPLAPVGDLLRIDGANFIFAQTSVKFGAVTAASVSVTAANQLFVTVPTGAVTSPVSVSTFAGTTITATNYIIANTAVILDFIPALAAPGTQVVLNGGDFSNASGIRFGGVSADFDVTSITQIIATVPEGGMSGLIEVITPSGSGFSLNPFTVLTPGPTFLTITPPAGKPGEPIVLGGVALTSVTNVLFGTVNASFAPTADTQISAIVPTGAVTAPIVMQSPFGNATSPAPFLVESVVTGFSPIGGVTGAVIVVTGFNLDTATYVAFNGTLATATVTAPSQLHVTVPVGATTGPLTIGFSGGSNTTTTNFTVSTGNPVIISFSPTNGFAGQEVILSGVEFFGASSLKFNGGSASFGVTAGDQILATVPPDATSGPLTIIGPGGTNVSLTSFYMPPRLTSLVPFAGTVGTDVTILGTNFLDAMQVGFAGSNGALLDAEITIVSNTEMRARVPTNVIDGPIIITTPGGVVASGSDFGVVPRIDEVEPLWGPGGSLVTIRGLSFENAASVMIDGIIAPIQSVSSSQVTVTVPITANDGPLQVFTSTTNATAPADFVVTRTGDISLIATTASVVAAGQPVVVNMIVTNRGPTTATGIRLTLQVGSQMSFSTASSPGGSCFVSNDIVTCTWPSITNGTSLNATVSLNASFPRTYSGVINLTHIETEQNNGDNFSTYVTTVVNATARSLNIKRTNDTQLIVQWLFSGAPLILQKSTNELTPQMVWRDLTDVRLVTNFFITNFFIETITGPRSYFRLKAQ
jgi:large repetitive protein